MAMRLSGGDTVDPDQGLAVAALVVEGESQLERLTGFALGDHARPGCEHPWQRGGELRRQRARVAIWRVEEDEIVLTRRRRCSPEEADGISPADLGVKPDGLE